MVTTWTAPIISTLSVFLLWAPINILLVLMKNTLRRVATSAIVLA